MEFGQLVENTCRRAGEAIPNCDPDTGIFYGVASPHEAPDWVLAESEGWYPEGLTEEEAEYFEPDVWIIDTPEFQCEMTESHVMIFRSPKIVWCRECSPCYPCAGDLGTAGDGPKRTYGFPTE